MFKLTELTYFLASLYNTPDDIRDILRKAGFEGYLPFIPFANKATVFWTNILFYLKERNGKLDQLITTVINDGHQENEYLKAVLLDKDTNFRSPYFNNTIDRPVEVEPKQLEKLTQGINTLLPISFLEKGIERSKAVVRILTANSLGSGFIIQNNYLLTNNHVIPDIETAKSAKIQFNYQDSITGALLPFENKELDPLVENGFETSKENDWTIIKLQGSPSENQGKYGFIEIKENSVKLNDFVNIIQHPGGETKKIALYHNLVIGCDDERVQYLTDTQAGSSGSPVFNTNWEVVALHHAGGKIKVRGTNKEELLNEGININLVIKELRNKGIQL